MKPPMGYYGGKTNLAERIAQLLPEHRHYVEPFAGSLAVLLAKQPSPMETVNDLDQDLVTFWRVLRDQPDELERVAAHTPHSRAEHEQAYDLDVPDLERARRVWVLLSQGRGSTLRNTGWRFYRWFCPATTRRSTTACMPGWERTEMTSWTGNGIRNGGTRIEGARVEVLWSNRPINRPDLFTEEVS